VEKEEEGEEKKEKKRVGDDMSFVRVCKPNGQMGMAPAWAW
jgi:hypothetical protein